MNGHTDMLGIPRHNMDPAEAATLTGAALLDEVQSKKDLANDLFRRAASTGYAKLYDAALQFYLSAVWLLKPEKAEYPEVLTGEVPAVGSGAVPLLGGWSGGTAASGTGASAEDEELASRETELRTSLHLNIAACALKREDHVLAC